MLPERPNAYLPRQTTRRAVLLVGRRVILASVLRCVFVFFPSAPRRRVWLARARTVMLRPCPTPSEAVTIVVARAVTMLRHADRPSHRVHRARRRDDREVLVGQVREPVRMSRARRPNPCPDPARLMRHMPEPYGASSSTRGVLVVVIVRGFVV